MDTNVLFAILGVPAIVGIVAIVAIAGHFRLRMRAGTKIDLDVESDS